MDYYLRLQELRQHINIVQAAQDGRLDLVKIALGRNEKDTIDTAFTRAAWHGHLDIVKFLLEMGADIHAERERALEEASAYGHADVVSFLLKSGADVHANNDEALLAASRNRSKRSLDIVKLLLENGANPNTNAALKDALERKDTEMVYLLSSYGATIVPRK